MNKRLLVSGLFLVFLNISLHSFAQETEPHEIPLDELEFAVAQRSTQNFRDLDVGSDLTVHDYFSVPTHWSEWLTGISFVDEDLSASQIKAIEDLSVVIIDNCNESDHGIRVGRVLAPKFSFVKRHVTYFGLPPFVKVDFSSPLVERALTLFSAKKVVPSIINFSMAAPDLSRATAKKLADRGTILVAAGGNLRSREEIPGSLKPLQKSFAGDYLIVAGATRIDGLNGHDSTVNGSHIDIYAPGDRVLSSVGTTSAVISYTSAAAPQVARGLTNIKALLPELSVHQARKLLRKTGLKGLTYWPLAYDTIDNDHFRSAVSDGILLNAYRLWKVGERLAKFDPRSWDQEIEGEDLYNFKIEADKFSDSALKRLNQEKAYFDLQRAFLLDPRAERVDAILENLRRWPKRCFFCEIYYKNVLLNATERQNVYSIESVFDKNPEIRVPFFVDLLKRDYCPGLYYTAKAMQKYHFSKEEIGVLLEAIHKHIDSTKFGVATSLRELYLKLGKE